MPLRGNYEGTPFDEPVIPDWADNEAMGAHSLEHDVHDGMKVAVLDGRSTASWIRPLVDSNRERITICTPSVAVATEFFLARARNRHLETWRLQLLGGDFDPRLLAVFGKETEDAVAAEAGSAELAVVSVKALLATDGPVGEETKSIALKRRIVEKANKIIWIAACPKVACITAKGPRVYQGPLGSWKNAVDDERNHVVVTTPAGFDPVLHTGKLIPDRPQTPEDMWRANVEKLRAPLRARLHVVKMPHVNRPGQR